MHPSRRGLGACLLGAFLLADPRLPAWPGDPPALPGGIKRFEKPACKPYAPVPVQPSDVSEASLTAWIKPMLTKPVEGGWILKFNAEQGRLPGMTRKPYRSGGARSKTEFSITGSAFAWADGDKNKVLCILAHEAVHAMAGEEFVPRAAYDRVREACLKNEYPGPALDKAVYDDFRVDCSKPWGKNAEQCPLLRAALLESCALKDGGYFKRLQDEERAADTRSLPHVVAAGADPWACWELFDKLPPQPPPKPGEDPDPHAEPKERAKHIAQYLTDVLHSPSPCPPKPKPSR